jgi:hypothetical protein
MSEIKYVVPQPIKDAVHNALASYPVAANTGHAAEIACESFAKALRENPIVPTKEQAVDLGVSVAGETVSERYALLVSEWQRRMFLAPEPEVPEAIKDLISEYATDSSNKDALVRAMARGHNADVIEAYRRGQQSKEGAK